MEELAQHIRQISRLAIISFLCGALAAIIDIYSYLSIPNHIKYLLICGGFPLGLIGVITGLRALNQLRGKVEYGKGRELGMFLGIFLGILLG